MKSKREREEACYICNHYHDYEGGEPCSVCGHRMQQTQEKSQQPSAYPSDILPGFLYLGSYDHASRSEVLKALGITHILNTVPTCPNLYKNSFIYHTATTTPPDFAECFKFLDDAKEKQTKVLVHCMSGGTRSPTIVIAYLMHLRRWRLVESFKWTLGHHAATQLTQEDQQRLQQFEIQCLGSSSVGFGGLQLAASSVSPARQPSQGTLFSWNSPGAQHNGALPGQPQQQQGPQFSFSVSPQQQGQPPGGSAPSPPFTVTPGNSAGSFVFGAGQ